MSKILARAARVRRWSFVLAFALVPACNEGPTDLAGPTSAALSASKPPKAKDTLPSESNPAALTLWLCTTAPCTIDQWTIGYNSNGGPGGFWLLSPACGNNDYVFLGHCNESTAPGGGNDWYQDPLPGTAQFALLLHDYGFNRIYYLRFAPFTYRNTLPTGTYSYPLVAGGSDNDAYGYPQYPQVRAFFETCIPDVVAQCGAYVEVISKSGVISRAGVFRIP